MGTRTGTASKASLSTLHHSLLSWTEPTTAWCWFSDSGATSKHTPNPQVPILPPCHFAQCKRLTGQVATTSAHRPRLLPRNLEGGRQGRCGQAMAVAGERAFGLGGV